MEPHRAHLEHDRERIHERVHDRVDFEHPVEVEVADEGVGCMGLALRLFCCGQ